MKQALRRAMPLLRCRTGFICGPGVLPRHLLAVQLAAHSTLGLSPLTSLRPFSSDHSRAFSTGSATLATSGAIDCLEPSADVGVVVQLACISLGRTAGEAEAALVDRLRANWFGCAADVAAMSDSQALALEVPLRLRDVVASALAQAEAAPTQHASRAALDGASAAAAAPVSPPEAQAAGPLPLFPSEDGETVAGAAEEGVSWQSLPIEQRRCPPTGRMGFALSEAPKASQRKQQGRYALSSKEIPPSLQQELDAMVLFGTERFFGAQMDQIALVTAQKYVDHLRGMLGWMHRVRGVPLEQLTLRCLVPSAAREGVTPAFDYVQWLLKERTVAVRTEGLVLRSVMFAAKFLYHCTSTVLPGSGEQAYSDLAVVKELRAQCNANRKHVKVAARTSDESLKWLDWPDYLRLVQELRRECAGLDAKGRPRARTAVAYSLQRYLIFGILSCVPDRQRTLRELEVGRTLLKENGRWLIKHGPGDYKTGRAYGERPPLVIAPQLYPELEAFIDTWREELKPTHALLFTQQNGQPLTDKSLYKLFWVAAHRLTGRRLNPHLVRDSIVTFLRSGNANEAELQALALYMGHSIDMQRNTYDRRTKADKVEPAVALLEALNARAGAGDTRA